MPVVVCVFPLSLCIRYILHLIDARWDGRWTNKPLLLFAVEFLADFVRLFLYLVFAGAVTFFHGLPLHLIREVCVAFQAR